VWPADEPDDALASVLAALAISARQANLARSDVIAEALTAQAAGTLTEDQRAAAQHAAHQLVGSAGTFGAQRASELGALLEDYLAGDESLRASGLAEARLWLDELRRALRAGHQPEE